MAISIEGVLPIRPHLRDFVISVENLDLQHPTLDLTRSSVIPFTLKLFLTGKMQLPKRKDYKLNDDYSEKLYFAMSSKRVRDGYIALSQQSIVVMNQFLHHLMHEMLADRIEVGRRQKVRARTSIEVFIEDRLADKEGVEIDTLKKANYRLRKEKKQGTFTSQNVPPLQSLDFQDYIKQTII